MTTPHPATNEHAAMAWLAGRLEWEHLLRALRARAEETGGPVQLTLPLGEPAGAPADKTRRAA